MYIRYTSIKKPAHMHEKGAFGSEWVVVIVALISKLASGPPPPKQTTLPLSTVFAEN